MNPLQHVSINYAHLSTSERRTCDLILDNPEGVIDNPIVEAAKFYNVSASSILRMSKKLGYKGYSEFKYAVEDSLKEQNSNNNTTTQNIIDIYKNVLDDFAKNIDEDQLKNFAYELLDKRIFTVGIGNSSLPAKQMIYSLYACNQWGECIDDNVKIRYLIENLSVDDIVVVFSVSGSLENFKGLYSVCKENKIKTALITMNDSESLNDLVDFLFVLPSLPLYRLDSHNMNYLDNRNLFNIFIETVMVLYNMIKKEDR